jgi:ATP-dependent protease ClpP protease subunit
MAALKEFREDASRAIFLTGEIDERLVNRLTPDVCRLRGENAEPITVYINSRGGFTYCAEQLRALFATPDQEGHVCRIITVATSRADSAAAGLLALGDYAIAYPAAAIHCHGSRMADEEITTERAEFLAASLKKSNDDFALRLARRTFARIAFHFANLRAEFPDIRKQAKENKAKRDMSTDLECFAFALHHRLSSNFQKLPQRAFFHHERLAEMSQSILAKKLPEGGSWLKTEAELLRRLIKYELADRKSENWTLSAGGIDELALDFKSLADYLFGPHQETLENHLDSFGVLFLTPEQIAEYQGRRKLDVDEAAKWLRQQARPLVEPMWYFVVSLCRLLQAGEYGLNATDAYWLGIVDEVIGERLPTLRLIAENPET